MMGTLHSMMAAAVLVVTGFAASAQAQENPEIKPPPDIWQAAAEGDV